MNGFSWPFSIEIDTTREYLSISLLSSPINHIPTVGETYLQTSPIYLPVSQKSYISTIFPHIPRCNIPFATTVRSQDRDFKLVTSHKVRKNLELSCEEIHLFVAGDVIKVFGYPLV